MSDVFGVLIDRMEHAGGSVLRADEVLRWPSGRLEQFVQMGLLREASRAREVWCDGCEEGCLVEPELRMDHRAGKPVAVHACRRQDCGGLIRFDPSCLQRWEIDVSVLAGHLAQAVNARGRLAEEVSGRLWLLGAMAHQGGSAEVFLARGLSWSDASAVFGHAHRLRRSMFPMVLSTARTIRPESEDGWSRACVRLSEIASMEDGQISVDQAALEGQAALLRPSRAMGYAVDSADLLEAEENILEALAGAPRGSMLQIELMVAAGYSKTVTREALRHLRELGLVAKPRGRQRKGDAVTARGREHLTRRRQANQQADHRL